MLATLNILLISALPFLFGLTDAKVLREEMAYQISQKKHLLILPGSNRQSWYPRNTSVH